MPIPQPAKTALSSLRMEKGKRIIGRARPGKALHNPERDVYVCEKELILRKMVLQITMNELNKDKKKYPSWSDNNKLEHKIISKPKTGEITHHKDGDKGKFHKENLQKMNKNSHNKLHSKKISNWFRPNKP